MAKVITATKPLMVFLLLVAYVDASPMRGNVVSGQAGPDCGPSAALTSDTVNIISRELNTNDDHRVDATDPDCGPSSAILANDNKDLEAVDSKRNMATSGGHTYTTEPDCGPSAALTVNTIGRELSMNDDNVDDVDPDCGPSSAILANVKDLGAVDTKSNVAASGSHTDTIEPDCGPSAALTVDTTGRKLSMNGDNIDDVDPDCGPSSAILDNGKDLEALDTKSNVAASGGQTDTTEPDCGPSAALTADTTGRKLSINDDNVDDVDPDCGPSSAILANGDKVPQVVDTKTNVVADGGAKKSTTEPDCGPSAALTANTIGHSIDEHVDVVDPDCGPSSAILANGNKGAEVVDTKSNMVPTNSGHTDTIEPDCGPSSAIFANGNKDPEAVDAKSNVVANGGHTDTTEPDCGPSAALDAGSQTNFPKATNGDDDKKSIESKDNKDLEAIDIESNMTANADRTDTIEPDCGPSAALDAGSKSDFSKATRQ